MRSAQKNNRSRGRGNRKSGGGGGNVVNRVFDSAGPEGKVRGTPQQIIDKYLSLARDAQTSGDRVISENFLQHAEHYQRLLIQATAQQEQNRRDQAESGQEFEGDEREFVQGDRRGQQQDRPQHQHHQHQQRQGAAEGDGEDAESSEIRGMTMIDSGHGGDDLLVASEDIAQSQPRRNGDGRRRRPRQAAQGSDDAPAEGADEPTNIQHEG
jgi:hypothetical protein